MHVVAEILTWILDIYMLIIVVTGVVTWMVAFNTLDATQEGPAKFIAILKKLTDPVLNPIRKYVKPLGGVDISPIIALVILSIVYQIVWRILW